MPFKRPKIKLTILFMNIQMPELDGIQATIRIRNEHEGKQPQIFALTSNVFDGDIKKCLESGMDGYFTKPIQAEQIKVVLEDL